ncbi:hypothetical protein EH31_04250 [Erythrobacter longus]|uniref:Uncharacterized protein n=1 Tax=Erythrobacter longus TaxID=1044 RepID=A0A074MAP4_ERYLO|nr:hypothetical protein EH31_04250 [Erythrobacter longus]
MFGALLSLLSASPAFAQEDDTQPQSEAEIVVEGDTNLRERRNELRQLAQDVLNKPRISQTIAKFAEPMCPRVFGLTEEAAKVIEARMRENAVSLGLNRVDVPEDCKHNTSVIFVPQEQGTADTWFNSRSDVLRHLKSYERIRVLEEKDPVRAWTYRPARLPGPVAVPTSQGSAGDRLAFADGPNQSYYASRLRRKPNPLAGATVLIELGRADGKSLTQLADYASMRTFGNARALSPEEVPAADTILTLFQDEDAPEELTDFDRSLVSMLYETSPTASRSLFYGNIARRAVRLEGEESEGEDPNSAYGAKE